MRSRRRFLQCGLGLVGFGLLSACGLPSTIGRTKPRRLGCLWGSTTRGPSGEVAWAAFRTALRDLGYIEGQNLLIEERGGDQLDEPLAALLRLDPEIILVASVAEARAVQAVTTTIPIVSILGDPVANGLAASLAHPGGNVTGLTTPVLAGKMLQLLGEVVPSLSSVAVLGGTSLAPQSEAFEAAARSLDLHLQVIAVDAAEDFERFFEAAVRAHADGLVVSSGPVILGNQTRIAELAIQHRLPSIWQQTDAVGRGGLMGYGPNRVDLYRRAAGYVDKIFKGANPGDVPIELPTTFDFVVNVRTAQALGLRIPQSVLAQATETIQ